MSNAAIKGLPKGSRLRDALAIEPWVTKATDASRWLAKFPISTIPPQRCGSFTPK